MKEIYKIYNKYKEIINYLIIGIFSTVVSVLTYAICSKILKIDYLISNIISWILAVLFAFITNKKYVFNSESKGKKQLLELFNFVKYRILSLLIDTSVMFILIELVEIDDLIAKIIVQFIIVVINYVFSKFFVFKDKKD